MAANQLLPLRSCLTHPPSYSISGLQANAKVESHGYSSSDIYLHTASLSHVGGLVSWLAMLKVGAQHVMMPKFSPQKVVDLMGEHSVTAMIAVPAMISDLVALETVPPLPPLQLPFPIKNPPTLQGKFWHKNFKHARMKRH